MKLIVGASALLALAFFPGAAKGDLSGAGTLASPYDGGSWSTTAITATPLTPQKGPADQYFGRFKFSNLEVRNTVHDLRIEGVSPDALQQQRFHMEEALEALVAWNDQYPRDPWLPATLLGLADQMHARQQADYDMASLFMYHYLADHFTGHYFGNMGNSRLSGFAPATSYDVTTFYAYPPIDYPAAASYPSVH